MIRPNAMFVLDSPAFDAVYAPSAAGEIYRRVNVIGPPCSADSIRKHPQLLEQVELLFSGWGAPLMDPALLDAAPNLRAIFYAAGAVDGWATQEMWDRNIIVTTATAANAIPVAEYTLATILLSLKHAWQLSRPPHVTSGFKIRREVPGNYRSTVGLIGMGNIGRLVVRMLGPFNTHILAHDPFLTRSAAEAMSVTRAELADVFQHSDVVSLHLPDLSSTRGIIDKKLIRSMKANATLINTARGCIIDEKEMIEVLRERPDLQAVLDVTDEEPLPASSPLLELPNVIITPHIAGSQGRECQRMADYMIEELDRYLSGQPLKWQVVRPTLKQTALHHLQDIETKRVQIININAGQPRVAQPNE